MILDFLYLGEYGQFVWPAFMFTFLSCAILYLKTKKELKKQEKIFFSEHEQFDTAEIKVISKTKHIIKEKKEALSSNSI